MLQHQIVQSPARLGLTNPTSPSLPPQNQQPNSPSPAASKALLPLLPPLRRAQSLLAQMASLAARLFEVSPNRSAFRGGAALPVFLSPPAGPTQPPPAAAGSTAKEVLANFAALQKQLFEAVAQLQEILDLQDSNAKAARDLRSRDAAALSFASRLKDAERLLDALLDDYSHYRRTPKDADEDELRRDENEDEDEDEDEGDSAAATTTVKSRLSLSDVLSYAHRISYTTFAPPEFGAGEAPLRGALPPAPQDEQMRASQLYACAGLDVGLPAAEPESRSFEPMVDQPPPAPEFGLFPANIPLPPAGWRPGMPVELPLPPPGWKPGDPVPLPPAGSMPSFLPPPPPPLRPAKPAGETIQVRHVELDILDQDDSSDYSSDDASSSDD